MVAYVENNLLYTILFIDAWRKKKEKNWDDYPYPLVYHINKHKFKIIIRMLN